MLMHNALMFLLMYLNRNNRRFLKRVNSLLREDPAYSLLHVLRTMTPFFAIDKGIFLNSGQFYINTAIPPIPSEAFFTFLNSVPRRERIFSQLVRLEKSAPSTFCLAVTDECVYNCFYCSNYGKVQGPALTTQEWIKVLGELQDMHTPVIVFTGGEPLMRSDLEQLVAKVDSRSLTYIATSGYIEPAAVANRPSSTVDLK